jgi:hypothetical protein
MFIYKVCVFLIDEKTNAEYTSLITPRWPPMLNLLVDQTKMATDAEFTSLGKPI